VLTSIADIRFVSLERGAICSLLRSIEKSFDRFVVTHPEAAYLSKDKIIRNEDQTISKQFQAGSVENLPAFLAASRSDARAEHDSF